LIGSGHYKALLIPDDAVQSDQAEKFVWVVDGDNKVHYRKVTCGSLHDGLRVVREGLTPEDRVIVKGIQRARPDAVVEAHQEELPPPSETDQAAGAPPAPRAAPAPRRAPRAR